MCLQCAIGIRLTFRTWDSHVSIGPVPARGRPQPRPFGEQLAAALDETGFSARRLAFRLSELSGGKPESRRRWIGKYLRGEDGVEWPTAESAAEVEQALGRPGYFTLPEPEPREARPVWRARVDVRLESLEERAVQVEDLAPVWRVLRLLASGDTDGAQRELSELEAQDQ